MEKWLKRFFVILIKISKIYGNLFTKINLPEE